MKRKGVTQTMSEAPTESEVAGSAVEIDLQKEFSGVLPSFTSEAE
jgi:hypothetical protein